MILHVTQAMEGFLAGIAAGAVMGAASDIAYRTGVFKSSLFVIDGSFFIRMTGIKDGKKLVYLAGVPFHLVTSGVFGAIYTLAAPLFGLPVFSMTPAAFYVFFLWLSMLFIALPVSGQGFIGKRSGRSTWFEQLLLHVLFFAAYYGALLLAGQVSGTFIQTIE